MDGVLGSKRVEDADYRSVESQRDKLIEVMESEFGLPEKLLKMRALSFDQIEEIRYASTRRRKNEMILNCILQNEKQQDLIKALSESFQTHLVNYINSKGEYKSEFGLDWPLTEREHEILNDNEEQLTDILDTCELLHKLCSKHVINVKQRNFISSRTSDQVRNEALLGMIRRLSKASYFTLIQCLKESHQAHIADILENGGALVPVHATLETDNMDETETQIADEFTNLLMQRTDSAEQANRVLNAMQLNIIAVRRGQSLVIYICCSTEDQWGRVCRMIDNSEMKNFLQQLFDLLTHNLNFRVLSVEIYESDVSKAMQIFKNNDASINQDPETQLQKVKVTIDRRYDFLVDRMFPDCVPYEKLLAYLSITNKQINAIQKKQTVGEKNELLIKYMIKNQREEKLFEALEQSDQKHLVKYLENDGIMVRVDSKLNNINDLKAKEFSAHIVNLINDINNEMHRVKDDRLLDEMLQLKLIGAKQSENVSLYFLCNQSEEVDRLQKLAEDGRLKEFVESFFNQLKRIQEEFKVTLKWKPNTFARSRVLIQAIRAKVQISQWTPTSISDIPLELIDVIIQKSFAIFIQMKSQTDYGNYQEGFKQLAEVNVCWFRRVIKRRFKNDLWSYLSGIYEKKNSISIFWRINRQFVEENVIRFSTGANKLKNQELLSDIQCALVARKPSTLKKMQSSNEANKVAIVLSITNDRKMKLFDEYLRLPECQWMAYAMRDYGTSVRVEINSRSPIEDEEINRFFDDSGSGSLVSMKDRDFVRWIWCKSSDPKELQQSKYPRHPFCHLLEESPQRINEIRINVDSDQLKRKAAVLHHIHDEYFETIHDQDGAVGVTKLRNEFYCLNSDGEMKVFYGRYPFVLLRKFQLKKTKEPKDIVSCEKENALYILDNNRWSPRVCVWKIEQNSKTNESENKWLELPKGFQPKTLSMSKSDQLLMVSENPPPKLRIYGLDAQFHYEISLHQDIQQPIHAVETSTGNVVIFHFIRENQQWTIATLSRDGKTIVDNYQPENEEQRLSGVGYLCIDSNDRVFVADTYKDRVILLDSNLRWNQILIPNDEFRGKNSFIEPWRLYYDEGKKKLFVLCKLHGVVTVSVNKSFLQ